MDKKMSKLVDDFQSGRIERRDFIKKLSILTGGTAAALGLLPLLDSQSVNASALSLDEEDVLSEFITYPGATGEVIALLSRPKGEKKLPAVIVIHENKGLQPHIQDVNKRMAKEGFLAIAPDALSPLGGTPIDDVDGARTKLRELDGEQTTKDFVAAVKYLDTHPLSTGKVGCTGFCWGGALTNQVAVNAPDLDAAVPYYGRQPVPEDVPKIKAAVMAHYAGDDERINAGIEAFEKAMKEADIEYQIFVYEGAQHAFNNDSNPSRYHEEAAKLAWKRTIGFFKEKLKS
ncbi:MAG: dienelactone hydrolase family protein [Bacteroidales bacterium]|nr:dienelactone hydrolase family protein [Bacteroidales bacterium]